MLIYTLSMPNYTKEIIPRELTLITQDGMASRPARPWHAEPDGHLNISKLLRDFQQFFRENIECYSTAGLD
jgi:hypothetical protein